MNGWTLFEQRKLSDMRVGCQRDFSDKSEGFLSLPRQVSNLFILCDFSITRGLAKTELPRYSRTCFSIYRQPRNNATNCGELPLALYRGLTVHTDLCTNTGTSPRKHGFNARSAHIWFVMDKMAQTHVSSSSRPPPNFTGLQFPPVNIILPANNFSSYHTNAA